MPNAKREEWYHFRRAILERNLKIDKQVFVEFEKYYHSQMVK